MIERKFLNEQEQKELSVALIEMFEQFLESKEVIIQNPEKDNQDEPSNIYGTDYYYMEENILKILRDYKVIPTFED